MTRPVLACHSTGTAKDIHFHAPNSAQDRSAPQSLKKSKGEQVQFHVSCSQDPFSALRSSSTPKDSALKIVTITTPGQRMTKDYGNVWNMMKINR